MNAKGIILFLIIVIFSAVAYAQTADNEYRTIANDFLQVLLNTSLRNEFPDVPISEIINKTILDQPFKAFTLSYEDILESNASDLINKLKLVAYGYPLIIEGKGYGVIFVSTVGNGVSRSSGSITDNYIIKMMNDNRNLENTEFYKVRLDLNYHEFIIMKKDNSIYFNTMKPGTANKFNIQIDSNNIPNTNVYELMPRLQTYSRDMYEKNEENFKKE